MRANRPPKPAHRAEDEKGEHQKEPKSVRQANLGLV